MNEKMKRQRLRILLEKSIIRDEERKRLKRSAMSSINEVLISLNSTLNGLDNDQVKNSRNIYGQNHIEDCDKKGVIVRLKDKIKEPKYTVTRKENSEKCIPCRKIVVGDIIHLFKGDTVPADLRVIEAEELVVNESLMNSDRKSVKKDAGICACESGKLNDFFNILLMGTYIVSGSAKAVVVSVGEHTILGTMK